MRHAMWMILAASWAVSVAMLSDASDEHNVVLAWWAVMLATATVLPVVYLAVEHAITRHADAVKRERKRLDDQLKVERRRTDARTEALIQAVFVRLAQEDGDEVVQIRQR